jgi:hypothetical protein
MDSVQPVPFLLRKLERAEEALSDLLTILSAPTPVCPICGGYRCREQGIDQDLADLKAALATAQRLKTSSWAHEMIG